MAFWTVRTYHKKCVEQHDYYTKDNKKIICKTGWRSASWTVTTSDDEIPEFDFDYVPGGDDSKDSVDMNNCYWNNVDECELNETFDNCWQNIEFPEDMAEGERQRLTELIEEGGLFALEHEEGWDSDDNEIWIWGPIEISNEAGETVRIIIADKDGNVSDFNTIE